jgi:hypothetical protein
MKLTGTFKKERGCKQSVRYIAADDVADTMTSVVYVRKEALTIMQNPEFIKITMEVASE